MADTSLFYYQDQWGKVQPRILRLQYEITGAVTVVPIISNSATLVTFAAIAAQSTIDNFLGTTDEFTIAQYDGTSMGADAMGVLVNMQGQCKTVVMMVASCYSASNTLVTRQVQGGTLTAATLETAIHVGADGYML